MVTNETLRTDGVTTRSCVAAGVLSFVLVATSLHAKIVPVTVTMDLVASEASLSPGSPMSVSLNAKAISVDGEDVRSDIRLDDVELPGSTVLGLDDQHVWQLELAASGWWAERRILALGDQSVRFEVWPTNLLEGRVQAPRGEPMPGELSVWFDEADEDETDARSAVHGLVTCPIVESRFRCEIPARVLDLKLRAKGFVSHYRWSVDLRAEGKKKLGDLALRPGASVVGTVAVEEGQLSPERCHVTLAPEVAAGARSAVEHRRQSSASLETTVSARGFFHFDGIPPGSYRISVSQPGYATTELAPVAVLARSETSIRDPFVLQRPVPLELFLTPETDPFGRPWKVELARRGEIPGVLETVDEGAAALDGSYVQKGLDPGDYVLTVLDSQASRFAWEEIALSRTSGPRFVTLDVTWVEGSISLGEDAVEGTLTFGGRAGTRRIAMKSDSEGTFGGYLPHAGTWEIYVESATEDVRSLIEVDVQPTEDGIATLEIELPDTRIDGRVVDARRRGVDSATVKLVEAETGAVTWRRTEEDGDFRFRGLAEGTSVVEAFLGDELSSDSITLQVSEDRHPPSLTLVLQEKALLDGRVVSSAGPVPGALLVVIPKRGGVGYPFSLQPHAVTDPTGHFIVRVPKDADRLELVVMPPGFALTTRVVAGPPSGAIEVPVEEYPGDLVLDLGDDAGPRGVRGAPSPLVVYDGIVLDASILRHWASLKLEPNADPSRLRVPSMAPGDYSACWFSYERFASALSGSSEAAPWDPARGQCAKGFLSPYGELDLDLPPRPGEAGASPAVEATEPRASGLDGGW